MTLCAFSKYSNFCCATTNNGMANLIFEVFCLFTCIICYASVLGITVAARYTTWTNANVCSLIDEAIFKFNFAQAKIHKKCSISNVLGPALNISKNGKMTRHSNRFVTV